MASRMNLLAGGVLYVLNMKEYGRTGIVSMETHLSRHPEHGAVVVNNEQTFVRWSGGSTSVVKGRVEDVLKSLNIDLDNDNYEQFPGDNWKTQ